MVTLLFKLLHLFQGYITIQIRGYAREKLINYLIRNDFNVWGIREKEDCFEAKLKAKDFKVIRKYAKRAGCRVKIKTKHGLPFLFNKLKSRQALILGVIVAILTIYILSSFIWFVEINGTSDIAKEEIFFLLEKAGFEYGMLKYSLNTNKIEKNISRHKKVAWTDVKISGTKLVIDIVEKVSIEQLEEKSQIADVVAKKSGLITDLIVLEGQPVVKEGQMVKRGEKLISGIVKHYPESSEKTEEEKEGEETQKEPIEIEKVSAKGIVKAKVWYESYGEAKLVEYHQQETGQVVNSLSVKYENKQINLYGPEKPPFAYFKVEETTKSLPSWRNINFPIEIIRKRYIKIKEFKEEHTLNEAKELAKKRALEKILDKINEAVIINRELTLISGEQKGNNIVRVKALITAKENIALQKSIQ